MSEPSSPDPDDVTPQFIANIKEDEDLRPFAAYFQAMYELGVYKLTRF